MVCTVLAARVLVLLGVEQGTTNNSFQGIYECFRLLHCYVYDRLTANRNVTYVQSNGFSTRSLELFHFVSCYFRRDAFHQRPSAISISREQMKGNTEGLCMSNKRNSFYNIYMSLTLRTLRKTFSWIQLTGRPCPRGQTRWVRKPQRKPLPPPSKRKFRSFPCRRPALHGKPPSSPSGRSLS